MQVLYTAVATARADEEAEGLGQGGALRLNLPLGERVADEPTAPEQLFAAGFAACFGGALELAAAQRRLATGPITTRAHVALNPTPHGGPALSVRLEGHLPNLPLREALALMQAAEQLCPYANALRGNIPVILTVAAGPLPNATNTRPAA